jgi:3D (Asp-Asp-Asp) domain-containing protein
VAEFIEVDIVNDMRNAIRCLLSVWLLLMVAGCVSIRPPSGAKAVERTVLTTGYCPCQQCCGWRRDWLGRPVYASGSLAGQRKQVGVTASGVRARKGTIAADTKLYPFGTVFFIDGYGYGQVEDRGGDIKGEHVDLFFRSHEEALEWGRRYRRAKVWYDR